MPFTLSSPTITDGAEIPVQHTCDGAGLAPTLAWSGAPDGTAELVMLMDDPDARDFTHWLVVDIPASALAIGPGALPAGARELGNSFGKPGYGGPCPPSGTHTYRFTLYALSAPVDIADGVTSAQVRGAISGVILGEATIEAPYTRRR